MSLKDEQKEPNIITIGPLIRKFPFLGGFAPSRGRKLKSESGFEYPGYISFTMQNLKESARSAQLHLNFTFSSQANICAKSLCKGSQALILWSGNIQLDYIIDLPLGFWLRQKKVINNGIIISS